MEQAERRIVVLGALDAAHLDADIYGSNGWQLLEARSPEAAEALLKNDGNIRVGVFPYAAEIPPDDMESFQGLRARHRRVQWLALLPPAASIDERLAAFIANDFFDYLTLPVEPARLHACAGHAHGMSVIVERAQGRATV